MTTPTISMIILENLSKNEEFCRKVLPFIKEDYFTNQPERMVFKEINEFVLKYNNLPTLDALTIAINNLIKVPEETVKSAIEIVDTLKVDKPKQDQKWLLDSTEKFCQKQAIYNAVLESIHILDAKKQSTKSEGAIPEILQQALAVSFDTHIGHDYFDDSDERFEFYHQNIKRFPFDIKLFNKITKGGVIGKTLNILMGGTGVFKTGSLCHLSTAYLQAGYNVLYITLEMAEEKIAERIDANLLNVSLDDLAALPKDLYEKKVAKARAKTVGKLIIKEYPTASASATHFRMLLNELFLKKNFKPDIIVIDYLNICASSRIKASGAKDLYTYVKSVAEEIRGLAVEFDVPIWSATQTNRAGFASSDPDLTNTSESWGLPATADLFLIIVSTEELDELGQLMFVQGKNRYNDITKHRRFIVGVDKSKMRLFDAEDKAQDDLVKTDTNNQQTNKTDKFKGLKV